MLCILICIYIWNRNCGTWKLYFCKEKYIEGQKDFNIFNNQEKNANTSLEKYKQIIR